jgi:aspartyl-tRNA(Asn)/glutamyl-tRNA(Gln) amidotransferase subunit B
MEEGSLRCDANVSVMLNDAKEYGKKVEIKNMNSIRNVQRAIEHETERQIKLLEKGEQVISETRTYDVNSGDSFGMRTKEELNDYRYFPDPDLSPLHVSEDWLNEIRSSLPALPRQLQLKFTAEYKLPAYDALVLTETKELAAYFEEVCVFCKNYKAVSNWIMGPVKFFLNEQKESEFIPPLSPSVLAALIDLVDTGKVSFAVGAQKIFPELIKQPLTNPLVLAQQMNLIQESNADSLMPVVNQIIKEFPLKVEEYKKGKKAIVTMFMGELMKRTKGKADPKVANELLLKRLAEQD